MATIDDVMAKLDALEIKIEAERSIKQICTTCNGVGTLIYRDDSQPGVNLSKACPLCNGNKYIDFGIQEAL